MIGFKKYTPNEPVLPPVISPEGIAAIIGAFAQKLDTTTAQFVTGLPKSLIKQTYKDIQELISTTELAMRGELTIDWTTETQQVLNPETGELESKQVEVRVHCDVPETLEELKGYVWDAVVLDFEEKAQGTYDVGQLEDLQAGTFAVVDAIIAFADGTM